MHLATPSKFARIHPRERLHPRHMHSSRHTHARIRIVLLLSLVTLVISVPIEDRKKVTSKSLSNPQANPVQFCPASARVTATHCLCVGETPICTGPGCVRGRTKRTNKIYYGFPFQCRICNCIARTVRNTRASGRGFRLIPATFDLG